MSSQDKEKTKETESESFRTSKEVSPKQEVSESSSSLAPPLLVETDDIFLDVSSLIEKARHAAYQTVNVLLIQRNWLIGKRIHEEELKDTRKENYGLEIITSLAKKLTKKYGKGYSRRGLYSFLDFYKTYPNIFQTMSEKSFLSWSHYLILLQVDDDTARGWYEKEASSQSWSVRALQRNVSTQYYYRLLKSQKRGLAKKEMFQKTGETPEDPNLEFIKNPAILEFLGIPENNDYVEKDLEKCLIANIKKFLMELGKGYAFVTSQKRIHTEKEDYFIDLVFYNYILKCFVLIDLKQESSAIKTSVKWTCMSRCMTKGKSSRMTTPRSASCFASIPTKTWRDTQTFMQATSSTLRNTKRICPVKRSLERRLRGKRLSSTCSSQMKMNDWAETGFT